MPPIEKKEEPIYQNLVPSTSGRDAPTTGKFKNDSRCSIGGGRPFLQKVVGIPSNLYIRKRPPEVLQNRLRSAISKNFAGISTIEAEDDPNGYAEAMRREDKAKWIEAMEEEISSLHKNEVWTLVDRPAGHVVTNRWVLRIKRKTDGSIDRYRARLVARGFSQIQGLDYNETYAPVVNTSVVRLLYAYAASQQLEQAQFDVKAAFLYGSLEEVVYME